MSRRSGSKAPTLQGRGGPPSKSCSACRRRKIKCNGANPCDQCSDHERIQDCQYVGKGEKSIEQKLEEEISALQRQVLQLQVQRGPVGHNDTPIYLRHPYPQSRVVTSPFGNVPVDQGRLLTEEQETQTIHTVLVLLSPAPFFLSRPRFLRHLRESNVSRYLLVTMHLIGAFLLRYPLKLQDELLAEAKVSRAAIPKSTEDVSRLAIITMQRLQAECLFLEYLICRNKLNEVAYHSSAVVSVTITLNLHQLGSASSPNRRWKRAHGTEEERRENIRALWVVLGADSRIAIIRRTMRNLFENSGITCPWPDDMSMQLDSPGPGSESSQSPTESPTRSTPEASNSPMQEFKDGSKDDTYVPWCDTTSLSPTAVSTNNLDNVVPKVEEDESDALSLLHLSAISSEENIEEAERDYDVWATLIAKASVLWYWAYEIGMGPGDKQQGDTSSRDTSTRVSAHDSKIRSLLEKIEPLLNCPGKTQMLDSRGSRGKKPAQGKKVKVSPNPNGEDPPRHKKIVIGPNSRRRKAIELAFMLHAAMIMLYRPTLAAIGNGTSRYTDPIARQPLVQSAVAVFALIADTFPELLEIGLDDKEELLKKADITHIPSYVPHVWIEAARVLAQLFREAPDSSTASSTALSTPATTHSMPPAPPKNHHYNYDNSLPDTGAYPQPSYAHLPYHNSAYPMGYQDHYSNQYAQMAPIFHPIQHPWNQQPMPSFATPHPLLPTSSTNPSHPYVLPQPNMAMAYKSAPTSSASTLPSVSPPASNPQHPDYFRGVQAPNGNGGMIQSPFTSTYPLEFSHPHSSISGGELSPTSPEGAGAFAATLGMELEQIESVIKGYDVVTALRKWIDLDEREDQGSRDTTTPGSSPTTAANPAISSRGAAGTYTTVIGANGDLPQPWQHQQTMLKPNRGETGRQGYMFLRLHCEKVKEELGSWRDGMNR